MEDDVLVAICAATLRPHLPSAAVAVDEALEIVAEVHKRLVNARELMPRDFGSIVDLNPGKSGDPFMPGGSSIGRAKAR